MSVPTESPVPPECGGEQFIHPGSENILLIVYASLALGIASFFTFCVSFTGAFSLSGSFS